MMEEGKIASLGRKFGCALELYSEAHHARVFSAEGASIHARDAVRNNGYAVRTIRNGHLGFFSFESLTELVGAVEKSIKLGRLQEKGDYFFPGKRGSSIRFLDRKAFDFEDWATEELEGMLEVHRKEKVRPVQNILGSGTTKKTIANSEGGQTSQESTFFYAISQCSYKDTEADDSLSSARFAFSPPDAARKAAEFAKASANAGPAKAGRMEVIFDIRGLLPLLQLFMPFNLNAESLRKKLTRLRIGGRFAGRGISIIDEPSMEKGARPIEFDDEGFRSKPLALIRNGRVSGFISDMRTAAKMKKMAPGNAFRGSFNSTPSASFTNISISGNAGDLLGGCDRGIYVNSFLTSGANAVTGDFSFPLLTAFHVKGGEIGNAIRGAMMKGNFFEMMGTARFEARRDIYNGLQSGRMACELDIIC
ncbi:MAG: TldD/PmbA family protein [Candidatus Micrarchaeota archaeon]